MSVRVEIELDIEKIQSEGKYDVNTMYQDIDAFFLGNGAVRCEPESGEGVAYTGAGTGRDFGIIAKLNCELKKQNWFTENVKRWVWFIKTLNQVICEDWMQQI